jgi:DNA-binding XRE family transcriptional regulator
MITTMKTQQDTAAALGTSQTTISFINTGERRLSKKLCLKMVELCGGTEKGWRKASYPKIKSALKKHKTNPANPKPNQKTRKAEVTA